MFLRLFLTFTVISLGELYLLVGVGRWLGLWPTLLLVLVTGAAGAWLARREGLRSWRAIHNELDHGRVPGESLFHAVLILMAGIVLVSPGVVTDMVGILFLIPPVRSHLIARARRQMADAIAKGSVRVVGGPGVRFTGMRVDFSAHSSRVRMDDPEQERTPKRRGSAADGGREIIVEPNDPGAD